MLKVYLRTLQAVIEKDSFTVCINKKQREYHHMQAVTISEARKRLFELREHIVDDHEEIIVTHKRGNIVLISMDEWESYQETLRLLKDKAALHALLQSFEDRDNRKNTGKPVEDVFTDLK